MTNPQSEAKPNGIESIAFENGSEEIHPPTLFRIHAKRYWHTSERAVNHVNWFATLEVAEAHAKWLRSNDRAKDVTLTQYVRVDHIARLTSERDELLAACKAALAADEAAIAELEAMRPGFEAILCHAVTDQLRAAIRAAQPEKGDDD